MNADLPLPPVTFRRNPPNSFNNRRTYPKIDEAEEFLLSRDDQQQQQNHLPFPERIEHSEENDNNATEFLVNSKIKTNPRQVQFLTPRKPQQYASYNNNQSFENNRGNNSAKVQLCKHQLMKNNTNVLHDFEADRVRLLPEPTDR